MTTYGMTPEGFNPKPAAAIRSDLIKDWKKGPGMANLRDTPNSRAGNTAASFANQLSQCYEATAAAVLSFSVAGANEQSLNNALTGVGQARQTATASTVSLTIWTFETDGPKSVPSGSQVIQSNTAVIWELTQSVDIPAATVAIEDLEPDSIEYQGGEETPNLIRANFPGSTDLSTVSAGQLVVFSGCEYTANDGAFPVVAVNDGSDYIDFTNVTREDNAADESGSDALASVTDGFTTVNAECDTDGEYSAAPQSVRTIGSATNGWEGVTNQTAATAGFDRWTDSEFRAEAAENTAVADGSTVAAILKKGREIDGVDYATGESDDDPFSATYGYAFTFVGGADQDIIDMIGKYKAAGVPTRGSESGTYINEKGNEKTIRFSRATAKPVYVEWTLTTDSDLFPSDGNDQVLAATAGVELGHGEDVYKKPLIGAVDAAEIPGLLDADPKFSFSASPTTSTPLAITDTEQAQFKNDGTYLTVAP